MAVTRFYLVGFSRPPSTQGFPKYSKVKLGDFCLFSTLISLANHISLFWEIVQERRIGIVRGAFANKFTREPANRGLGAFAQAFIADSANATSVQGEVS